MRKFISDRTILISVLLVLITDLLFFVLLLQPSQGITINPGCSAGMLCDLGDPQSNNNLLKLFLNVDITIFASSYIALKLLVYSIDLYRARFKRYKK